ncbi:MAG: hypothetical protein ACE5HC_06740 [Candidatus Binatia bacterium]
MKISGKEFFYVFNNVASKNAVRYNFRSDSDNATQSALHAALQQRREQAETVTDAVARLETAVDALKQLEARMQTL